MLDAGDVVYLLLWWIFYATMHRISLTEFIIRRKGCLEVISHLSTAGEISPPSV